MSFRCRDSRGGGGSPFTGRVDELHVFPRALTEAEVAVLAGGPTFALAAIEPAKRTKEQTDKLRKFFRETQATDYLAAKKSAEDARKAKTDFDKTIPSVMVMAEMTQPRDTFIKVRGAYDKNGDKVEADVKTAIETALADLKTAREGTDAEDIRAKTNTLVQASMKLGEAMYAAQQGTPAEGQPADDGVVDAEFEDVSDTDEKKSA